MLSKMKNSIRNHELLKKALFFLSRRFNPFNKYKVSAGTKFYAKGVFLHHCVVEINGENNEIEIDPGTKLKHCRIFVSGNNNRIHIGSGGLFVETEFYIEDNNNTISVGKQACFCGETQLAAIEGTKIEVGSDCLFSSNIRFRTGDSHSIIDSESGERINPSADIVIGEHVWVGSNVTCLKGVEVASNCIVGTSALLTKKYSEPGCVLVGIPAEVSKRNITWQHERV